MKRRTKLEVAAKDAEKKLEQRSLRRSAVAPRSALGARVVGMRNTVRGAWSGVTTSPVDSLSYTQMSKRRTSDWSAQKAFEPSDCETRNVVCHASSIQSWDFGRLELCLQHSGPSTGSSIHGRSFQKPSGGL